MATKKLFEYLVVRDQLKTQTKKLTHDLAATFEKKRHLFEEKRKTFTPSTEAGGVPTVEEQSDIQTTVVSELKWLAGHWVKSIDVARQVEEGNTLARADVVLDDGKVLLANVPATALLELVQRADEIVSLLQTVPTLDPSKAFREDASRGENIFRARDVSKKRTKKIEDFIVVVPATTEHPAQVAKINKDIETGDILEQEWSGLVTPARKSDMLARAEELRRAVKSALQRANASELPTEPRAGKAIFEFVLGETL